MDLAIAPGQTVALVGPSGAGKTTHLFAAAALLRRGGRAHHHRRHRHPRHDAGRACAGRSASCSRTCSCSPARIRENIAYGRLGASDAEILDAARRARLDAVIAELPEGLDTLIGERGVKLSGGQKQRLAIARIFLKNPPILILDEATSALDTETERAIQAALAELAQGRTTLVIAHRLATIRERRPHRGGDGAGHRRTRSPSRPAGQRRGLPDAP